MIPAIWKSAALAGVVGVGCGGVWYVQRDLATTAPLEPNKFSELDPSLKGEPAPSPTGSDPFALPEHPAPKSDAGTATLASAGSGNVAPAGFETLPDQAEPQTEPQSEPAASGDDKSLLALATPSEQGSSNPFARRAGSDIATATLDEPAAKPKTAKAANSDPWGDIEGVSAAPKGPSKFAAASESIELVANSDEGRPVEGAADGGLTALPPNHPGPVLMEVPKRTAQTESKGELFMPEIGGQSEPSASGIQQVQNELPEIRPTRSRSSIPDQNNTQAASPYYERNGAPGAADALPMIRPAGGNAPRSAIVPGVSDFSAGNDPGAAKSAAPAPTSNPFEFIPAPAQGAAPAAPATAPAQPFEPTPAANAAPGLFPPANNEPAKAPVRSTIPGGGLSPVAEPSKFVPPPIQPEPVPVAPAAPGNRDAIPELRSNPFGAAPAAPVGNPNPAAAPGPTPTAAPNPFGTAAPANAFPPAGNLPPAGPAVPPRRDPVIDLIGDGTVAAGVASGPQQPEVKIEKIAPTEAVIGEALIYQIFVRNVGQSTAHRVVVEDRIPLGATCQGTIPQAETAEKKLYWKLGDLRPGEEREIKVKLTPTQAGSIGSVATVSFAAEVAATTVITAPQLKVELQAPKQVLVGESSTFRIKVQNSGQGMAKGVFLRALLPKELKHPGGNDLEYEIGSLTPGQTKDVDLHITADAMGNFSPKVIVSTNNQEQDSRIVQINAIDTRLKIVRTGPAKRFVGRPAAYMNSVTNQSLDALRDVTIVEAVPRDLEPTGKLSNGQWDPNARTITWRLAQIGAGEKVDLPIDLVPKKPGAFDGTLQASDATGNRAHVPTHVDVAGYSNLVVDVVPDGPVAVGEQVSMRLSVRNRGTAAASNVQTVFEVPPHLKFVNANGPVQHQAAGNVVHFAALDVLPPGGEKEFDIVLTAAQEGDARVKVDLYSDDHKTDPLHEEGEVRVYRDAR